jgi:serine protease inhibitor
MVASIKDPDLFRANNKFAYDIYTKRLGNNPLVKRRGTNPTLRVSCSTYHDE